jgi:drug/metabolite transporter (DMT)-like permease
VHPIVFILVSGALGVGGQLILKQALAAQGPLDLSATSLLPTILALATSWGVLLGLVVYLSGTCFWLLALSRVDLSYAYPFASLNYVLVLLSAWLWLGEEPTPRRLLGVLAICLGVLALSRTPARSVPAARSALASSPAAAGGVEG